MQGAAPGRLADWPEHERLQRGGSSRRQHTLTLRHLVHPCWMHTPAGSVADIRQLLKNSAGCRTDAKGFGVPTVSSYAPLDAAIGGF